MPSSVPPEHLAAIAALLGEAPSGVTRVTGGGNNRLYRVEQADGRTVAAKVYPSPGSDPRDRLGVEFAALRFLSGRGVAQVPAALAADRAAHVALYDWVDGEKVAAPTDADVAALGDFAALLRGLRAAPGADALPLASEACLSLDELVAQVERRLTRLQGAAQETAITALAELLEREVTPALARFAATARSGYAERGWETAAELDGRLRTLSPSDFGFHNCLRRPDGGLTFIDFEYFGWDDPVKLAADLLLHPGMAMSGPQKRVLAGRMGAIFVADDGFAARLMLLYPLYALRWVMIILNEFLPERWSRRHFAGAGDRDAAQAAQLGKAQALLGALIATNGRFIHDRNAA